MKFLEYDHEDLPVAMAILAHAQKERSAELKWFADYVSGRTAGLAARSITRWMARNQRRR